MGLQLWYSIVTPENRTVSLVEKKQLNLLYVTAKNCEAHHEFRKKIRKFE